MIIGISGKIGSGKDTIGKIIQYLTLSNDVFSKTNKDIIADLEHNGYCASKSDWEIKKFADKLKDIICLLIGCTRERLEDIDFKNKELGQEWWYYQLFDGRSNIVKRNNFKLVSYLENVNKYPDKTLIKLTPRKLLQFLGTDCGRDIIHPNIWVNALFADYKLSKPLGLEGHDWSKGNLPKWIITDVRFPNEAQAVKDRGGIVIRVNRSKNKHFISEGTKPIGLVEVIRKLDNEEEIKWTCFWDNGWYDSSGVNIPNVLKWENKIVEHPSETALDNYKDWDYVIDNNDSLESLIEKVKIILEDLKLI